MIVFSELRDGTLVTLLHFLVFSLAGGQGEDGFYILPASTALLLQPFSSLVEKPAFAIYTDNLFLLHWTF